VTGHQWMHRSCTPIRDLTFAGGIGGEPTPSDTLFTCLLAPEGRPALEW